MARAVATVPKRRGIPFVPTVALSFWRLRQTWRLLLISGLGVLAAVVLVCAVPLFSQVAMSAGLREALRNFPEGTSIQIGGNLQPGQHLTAADLRTAQTALNRAMHDRLGDYLAPGEPAASVSFPFPLFLADPNTGGANKGAAQLLGADLSGDTAAYTLQQGRLPNVLSSDLEVAVSPQLASDLHLAVGDTHSFSVPGPTTSTVTARVVGILTDAAAGRLEQSNFYGPRFGGPDGGANYVALASNDTLLALADTLLPANNGFGGPSILVNWYFPLDLSRVTASRLGDLENRLQDLSSRDIPALGAAAGFDVYATGNVLSALYQYTGLIIVAQIPIVLLLILVIGLVLLFISLVVNLLIERQVEAIAILRSRGASRGLVLRTMTFQSVGVGVLALVGGPLLALLLVHAVGAAALAPKDRDALDVLSRDPLGAAWDVRWYALAAAICAVVAMIVSTRRAAGSTILSLRRESARSNRKPFWVRLNLDLVFAGVAVLGYAAYSYLIQHVPVVAKPFLSVLSLFGMSFLLLAVALLFLRFFPLLLRLLARIASGRRAAAPMLAIGQMARSPRQASRMTLLLALSTAFALFALIFSASQAQRLRDVAAYQTGSDFRGTVTPKAKGVAGQRELETTYGAISGVSSASAVSLTSSYGGNGALNFSFSVLAVNADTFARTALWGPQESDQPLDTLTAKLASARASATDAVPAVVDDVLWQSLRLSPGAQFQLQVNQSDSTATTFVAVAHAAHIPPIADDANGGFGSGESAILVDLATLNTVYSKAQGDDPAKPTHILTPNEVWLHTADDATALASVRAAISSGPLQLGAPSFGSSNGPAYAAGPSSAGSQPLDRRQTIADAEVDALHVDLISVLGIAAGTALVLALVGILLGSWLNARNRLTSFALLRALGSEPRQLASVLLWEQGIVYALSLGLGVVIGAVLSAAVLPAIIFTTGTSSRFAIDYQRFLESLDVPPIQTVVPWPQVGIVLGGLVAISLVSILLMTAQVARPSISQTLRLNED